MTHTARLAMFLLCLLGLLALSGLVLEPLWGMNGEVVDIMARYSPLSTEHLLGTDALGRDILLRLSQGARVAIIMGVFGTAITMLFAISVGVMSGYLGGLVDRICMRLVDLLLVLPWVPVLLILSALLAGSQENLFITALRLGAIIAVMYGASIIRMVRNETLSLKERDYIRSAHALGCPPVRVIVRHLLPNLRRITIVAATLTASSVLLLESTLSFLGFGIQPPLASWGNMLMNTQEILWQNPWLAVYPGLLLFLTVLSLVLLGDWLQSRKI
jgi:peptide/nickel transport system permease protein